MNERDIETIEGMAYMARMQMDCCIDGDKIVFGPGGDIWNISLSRCSTPADILCWVLYLSKKQWMTPDTLDKFARLAAHHHGITIPSE